MRYIAWLLFMFCFLMIGFGFAFYVLFRLSATVSLKYAAPWKTIFAMFDLWTGMESPLDEDFEADYTADGVSSLFIYVLYVLYVIGASVMFLNITTATLTNTLEDRLEETRLWRKRAIQLATWFERRCPCFRRISRFMSPYRITGDDQWKGRLMMHVPRTSTNDRSDMIIEMSKAIDRLERKLERQMFTAIKEIHNVFHELKLPPRKLSFCRSTKR